MQFELEPLPYAKDALEPYISQRTLDYHYDKHHNGYMQKLKDSLENTPEADKTLEQIIIDKKDQSVYNLAAQVWNHTFYWHCMCKNGGGEPSSAIAELLTQHFGSVEKFKQEFTQAANGQFGSGWAWLVKDKDDSLRIMSTSNAENPLSDGLTPLLTFDVWEHAYYLDYQNGRADYTKTFFESLINWEIISQRLK